jgi:hypothetical protein
MLLAPRTHRSRLLATALAGAGLLVAACGGDDKPAARPAAPAPAAGPDASVATKAPAPAARTVAAVDYPGVQHLRYR